MSGSCHFKNALFHPFVVHLLAQDSFLTHAVLHECLLRYRNALRPLHLRYRPEDVRDALCGAQTPAQAVRLELLGATTFEQQTVHAARCVLAIIFELPHRQEALIAWPIPTVDQRQEEFLAHAAAGHDSPQFMDNRMIRNGSGSGVEDFLDGLLPEFESHSGDFVIARDLCDARDLDVERPDGKGGTT